MLVLRVEKDKPTPLLLYLLAFPSLEPLDPKATPLLPLVAPLDLLVVSLDPLAILDSLIYTALSL